MIDWKHLMGIAMIITASGFFARSIQPAQANMPVGMQWGEFPYENFSYMDGTLPAISNGSTHDLLTIPNDRIFIVTAMTSSYSCYLYVDGNMLRGGNDLFKYNYPTIFTTGNAHLVVPAGSTLQVVANGSTCTVTHFEGYYAHAP